MFQRQQVSLTFFNAGHHDDDEVEVLNEGRKLKKMFLRRRRSPQPKRLSSFAGQIQNRTDEPIQRIQTMTMIRLFSQLKIEPSFVVKIWSPGDDDDDEKMK